jgi:hypothetical protein
MSWKSTQILRDLNIPATSANIAFVEDVVNAGKTDHYERVHRIEKHFGLIAGEGKEAILKILNYTLV